MKRILNLFLSDKQRMLSFCEAHTKEIAHKFIELSRDHDLDLNLKYQIPALDYNPLEEQRKLKVLIREKLIHHFFPYSSFNQSTNAALGVIDRSGCYSLLSFSLCSLREKFSYDENFSSFIGTIAESVSELLCRTIPRIYVYGHIRRDVLYDLVAFYSASYKTLVDPQVIAPITWSKLYGRSISVWSAPKGSFLKNVDLTGWDITVEQVEFAFGDASVTLPGGITPDETSWPKHWPVWDMKFFYEDWLDSNEKIHLAGPGFLAEWRRWQSDPHSYKPPSQPLG